MCHRNKTVSIQSLKHTAHPNSINSITVSVSINVHDTNGIRYICVVCNFTHDTEVCVIICWAWQICHMNWKYVEGFNHIFCIVCNLVTSCRQRYTESSKCFLKNWSYILSCMLLTKMSICCIDNHQLKLLVKILKLDARIITILEMVQAT